MTTVATDGKSISSDSRIVGDYIDQIGSPKIFRVGEQLIGVCGSYTECLIYIDWLKAGQRETDRPKFSEFEAIHVSRNGVYWIDKDLQPIKASPKTAIGSGGRYAMAAMLAGADTKKAVQIAAKLDPYTGGKIVTMRLK